MYYKHKIEIKKKKNNLKASTAQNNIPQRRKCFHLYRYFVVQ